MATLLRILLKTLYIDTSTGFYQGGMLLAYIFSLTVLMTTTSLAWGIVRAKDMSGGLLRGNRLLEISAFIFGVTLTAVSIPKLMTTLAMDFSAPVINRLPVWLLVIENVLGIISGLVLVYLAFCLLSGARRSGTQGMLALIIVVWQVISMVERYISFRQVNTVSDQFLETMFLVCATLFLLANTRCMAGIAKNRKTCVLWGLLSAHLGLVLISGQLVAMLVLGNGVSGPPSAQMAIIGALSLYAVAVSCTLILSAES